MLSSLHFSNTLLHQLNALRQAGRKGELAVRHYERICTVFRSTGLETEEIYAKRTKNGEFRLKHCVKYDLGGGYRLVTIRLANRLYLPFIGSHDEVDQYLDRQRCRDFEPVESAYQAETLSTIPTSDPDDLSEGEPPSPEADQYEEQLSAQLDENMLKSIFCGLCQKQHSS